MTAPARVRAVVGPGSLPDGARVATERRAAALGLGVDWVEVADEHAAARHVRAAATAGTALLLAAGDLSASTALTAAVTDTDGPSVHVDAAVVAAPGPVALACDRRIHGRGRASFTWAVRWLATGAAWPGAVHRYGDHPAQVGELRLPGDVGAASRDGRARPVAVLVHGGFWLDWWEHDLTCGLAVALARRGWATWNLEYRRLGPSGGGFPASLDDVCAGVDALHRLADRAPLDLDRVVVVGHSAGALLAAHAVARHHLDAGASGHRLPAGRRRALVRPVALVALAGVLDLEAAAADDLGAGAVRAFLGPPAQHQATARRASPHRLVPLGVETLVVHGRDDRLVPPSQSRTYARAARAAGDTVALDVGDGDHFAVIDPDDPAFGRVASWLDAWLASRNG